MVGLFEMQQHEWFNKGDLVLEIHLGHGLQAFPGGPLQCSSKSGLHELCVFCRKSPWWAFAEQQQGWFDAPLLCLSEGMAQGTSY